MHNERAQLPSNAQNIAFFVHRLDYMRKILGFLCIATSISHEILGKSKLYHSCIFLL